MSSTTTVVYESFSAYLQTKTQLYDKIAAIDAIIAALMLQMVVAAEKGTIQEYQLNDGMTVIKAIYRDVKQIEASVMAMERLRVMYLKRYNGTGVIRMVDAKNFM